MPAHPMMADFRDPEALFYSSRHLAHLGELPRAMDLLRRAIDGGFFCSPAFSTDRWLDPLRKQRAFSPLIARAETQHREAVEAFPRLRGGRREAVSGPGFRAGSPAASILGPESSRRPCAIRSCAPGTTRPDR